MNMITIAGGTFDMGNNNGSDDERPEHPVNIKSFEMSDCQVTQKEWSNVMNTTDMCGAGDNYPMCYVSWYDAIVFCNKLSMRIEENLAPVYSISGSADPDDWGAVPANPNAKWDAVEADWSKNGYRLPTEAEWEYAAKGGKGSPGNYIYSGSDIVNDVAWYGGNSYGVTNPVKTKFNNNLGLYDMSGNVWEWCWDWYNSSYYSYCYSIGVIDNPKGPSTGKIRVCRGGGIWKNSADVVRSENRAWHNPYERFNRVGFRVARNFQHTAC